MSTLWKNLFVVLVEMKGDVKSNADVGGDELELVMSLTVDGCKVMALVRSTEDDEDKSTNELCLKSLSQK